MDALRSVVSRFSHFFGLKAKPTMEVHTRTDRTLGVSIFKGTGFGTRESYYEIETSDSPAQVACNLVNENPHLADEKARIWIHDPKFVNPHPFRFRCTTREGIIGVSMIDPRRR
jgi:hypothetical protein